MLVLPHYWVNIFNMKSPVRSGDHRTVNAWAIHDIEYRDAISHGQARQQLRSEQEALRGLRLATALHKLRIRVIAQPSQMLWIAHILWLCAQEERVVRIKEHDLCSTLAGSDLSTSTPLLAVPSKKSARSHIPCLIQT